MKDLTAILPQDTVACLQLADNGRRIPFRALTPGLFLIGSGPSCDLRLGDSGVPSLHSMIRVDETGAQIALLSGGPPLVVRGIHVHCADLTDGDTLEIGAFRAVYRSVQATTASLDSDASAEFHEHMLRLPESATATQAAVDAPAETLDLLSSQLADQFRMLNELQEHQRVLAEKLQKLADQLQQLQLHSEVRPPRRASA